MYNINTYTSVSCIHVAVHIMCMQEEPKLKYPSCK